MERVTHPLAGMSAERALKRLFLPFQGTFAALRGRAWAGVPSLARWIWHAHIALSWTRAGALTTWQACVAR